MVVDGKQRRTTGTARTHTKRGRAAMYLKKTMIL
jgi:hypothetical protein